MAYKAASLLGGKEIAIRFTDKPVTPWGGLMLVTELAREIGLEQALGTVRTRLPAMGAVVGRSGQRTVLRLSLAGPWRQRFERALAAFFPSTNLNRGAVGTG